MRIWIAAALLALGAPAHGTELPPVIDMHLHADSADAYGPPPLAMCTPFEDMPVWDQRQSYADIFIGRFKKPSCADPVWSPTTDQAVLAGTLAAMERRNVYGVLSGSPQRVAEWRKAAPGRFWSGLGLRLERNYSVRQIAELRQAGQLDVLAEVSTQYEGIAPTDARLEPYWALAERLEIPVGIHVGTGPFGVIYLGSADTARACTAR